jgi:hypothetical protein
MESSHIIVRRPWPGFPPAFWVIYLDDLHQSLGFFSMGKLKNTNHRMENVKVTKRGGYGIDLFQFSSPSHFS